MVAASHLRRLGLGGIVLLFSACASTSRPPPDRETIEAAPSGTAARIRAEQARLEGTRSAEKGPRLLDEAQVRVSERPRDDQPAFEGTRVAVQLPVKSPWEIENERRARRAESEAVSGRLDRATLSQRVEACLAGVELAAWSARRAEYEPYARKLDELVEWTNRLVASGVITEVDAARVEVEARTHQASREPLPPTWRGFTAGELPEVTAARGTLRLDPELVRDTIRRHHPDPRVHEAVARRYAALAARQLAATMPWLDHLRVSYDLPGEVRQPGWGGQVALRLPFGGDQRAQAARYDGLRLGEELEAAGQIADQSREALAALETLSFLEERAEKWRQLLTLAENAERTAERWFERRQGEVAKLVDLLGEAQAARQAWISTREKAGYLGCSVLANTGVPIDEWPRASR